MAGYPNMNPQQPFYNQGSSRPNSNTNSPMIPQQFMQSNTGSNNMQFDSPQIQQFAEFQRAAQGMGNNVPIQVQQQMRQGSPQMQQGIRPPIQRTPSQPMMQQMYQQVPNFQQTVQQPMRSVPPPAQPRPSGTGTLPSLTPQQMMAIVQNPELFQQLGPGGRAALETMIRNSQAGSTQSTQQRIPQPQPQATSQPQARRGSSHSPQIPYQHFNQVGTPFDGQSPPPPYSSPRMDEPASSPQMQMQQLQQANRTPINLSAAGLQAAQANRGTNRPSAALPNQPSASQTAFRPPTGISTPRSNPIGSTSNIKPVITPGSRLPPPPTSVPPKPTIPLSQIPSVLAESKPGVSGTPSTSGWESISNSAMKRRPSSDASDRPKKKVTVADPPKPQVFFTSIDPSPKPEIVAPRPTVVPAPVPPRPIIRERLVDLHERRVRGAEGIRGAMRNERQLASTHPVSS